MEACLLLLGLAHAGLMEPVLPLLAHLQGQDMHEHT